MLTPLHKRLKSMCRITRGGEQHWFIVGSQVVYVPDVGVVTTRRCIYAAFKGEVPEGFDVVGSCGAHGCASPEHAELAPTRRKARALSLPYHLSALGKPNSYQPPVLPSILPKGVTTRVIGLGKQLIREGNTLKQVAAALQLPLGEVVRISNGVYDVALRNNEVAVGAASATKRRQTLAQKLGEVDVGAGRVTPTPEHVRAEVPLSEFDGLSDEEAEWLRSIR